VAGPTHQFVKRFVKYPAPLDHERSPPRARPAAFIAPQRLTAYSTDMSALALATFDQATQARPSALFAGFFAALADLGRSISERVEQAERESDEAERVLDLHMAQLWSLLGTIDEAVAKGDRVEWDTLIHKAELVEREVARDFANTRKLGHRLVYMVRKIEPDYARPVSRLLDRYEGAMARYLESLRDARWNLMAARATYEPSERSQVFSDHESLARFLASASA
jgi:hypothetical protein